MKYSFIKPRKKLLIDIYMQIWLLFMFVVLCILLFFNFFISYKINDYENLIVDNNKNRELLESSITKMEKDIQIIKIQKELNEEIIASNLILKDSVKNLFDLIPDQITLKKVEMTKNALVLQGTTPSKNAYNLLLASPLKSIFHKTQVKFYLKSNGWYNFVSVNTIEDKSEDMEDNVKK